MAMMDLPVETIACILGLTTPRDVKRMAAINKTFLEASRSNLVWENFLPPHWEDLFHTTPPSLLQVYDQLCEGVCEQGDSEKIYTIDRPTGFLTAFLGAGAKTLTVMGGDEKWWEWIEGKSTRVKMVARLKDICWLEIKGTFKGWLSPGKYSVSFSLQIEKPHWYHQTFEEGPQAMSEDEISEEAMSASEKEMSAGEFEDEAGSKDEVFQDLGDELEGVGHFFPDARQDLRDELEAGVQMPDEPGLTFSPNAQHQDVEAYPVRNDQGTWDQVFMAEPQLHCWPLLCFHSHGDQSGGDQDHGENSGTDEDFGSVSSWDWIWEKSPILFKLVVDGMVKESSAYLCAPSKEVHGSSLAPARKGEGSWVEFEIGQFVAESGDCPCEIEKFSMMEIVGGHWKSGLLVEGLSIKQIA